MGPWYDEAYFRATGRSGETGLLTNLDRHRHPNASRRRDRFTLPAAALVLLIAGAAVVSTGLSGGILADNGALAAADYSSRP